MNFARQEERSTALRLKRQDRIIQFLKQRLNYSEAQMDESMRVLRAQERIARILV